MANPRDPSDNEFGVPTIHSAPPFIVAIHGEVLISTCSLSKFSTDIYYNRNYSPPVFVPHKEEGPAYD